MVNSFNVYKALFLKAYWRMKLSLPMNYSWSAVLFIWKHPFSFFSHSFLFLARSANFLFPPPETNYSSPHPSDYIPFTFITSHFPGSHITSRLRPSPHSSNYIPFSFKTSSFHSISITSHLAPHNSIYIPPAFKICWLSVFLQTAQQIAGKH